MKKSIRLFCALLVTSLFSNCGSDNDPVVTPTPAAICNTTGTEFQTIFGTGGSVTYDFDVHSYDFVLTQNKTVCKIGYQSNTHNASNPYTIKILQGSTVIYNQPHTFSNTAISYVTPTTPVNLTAGVTYTIERWQTNSGSDNMQNVGKVNFTTTFPATSSFMTITGSYFYFDSTYINPNLLGPNGTSTLTDTALPYIDIVFEQ
jgi:hypothetical protein